MICEFVLILLIIPTFVTFKCVIAFEEVSIQDEIVETYKALCPVTDICLSHKRLSQFEPRPNIVPCCEACSCDENCGQHCCPDKKGIELKLPPPVDDSLGVCITAQYRKTKIMRSYYMTSKCPTDYRNKMIKDSCAKEYFDFNLLDGIKNVPPVTRNATNVIYKNRMCALCNGEDEENLNYWTIRFECQYPPGIFPSSTSMVFKIVNNDITCNLIFEPPTTTEPYPTCTEGLIERCNVTGNWDTYNATTDKACNSYTSWYDNIYKNVHCFLCNGYSEVNVKTYCLFQGGDNGQRNSFIALLDFNQLEKRRLSKYQEMCPAESVYDPIKEKCLPLHCGHGFNLVGSKCMPLFATIKVVFQTEWSAVVSGMTWTLVPKQSNSSQVLHLDTLRQDILHTITIKASISKCLIYSFIKTKKSIGGLMADMRATNRTVVTSDVDFIALKVLIYQFPVTDVAKRIKQLTESPNFNFSEYAVISSKIMMSNFSKAFNESRFSRISEERKLLHTIEIPSTRVLSFKSAYDDGGKGVLPFFFLQPQYRDRNGDTTVTFELDSDPFCPKVELLLTEYTISWLQTKLFINEVDEGITTEAIVMSEDGSSIYVCYKDFISMVEKQNENNKFTHTPLSILTIILNSVSLLALAVTLIIYSIFPSLRTIPGLNNMGLVNSLIAVFSFSLVNACVDISTVWLCRLVGIGLHFSLLSSFCWMFVCTLHMVRVFATISERTVQESKTKQFVLYAVSSEIFSALVVIATIVTGYVLSDGDSIGYTNDPCYTDPDMLVYNVAIPVGVVIVLNFGMFLYVIYTISRLPDMRKNSSHERQNITIFIKLSTLTGLTWTFAFVYQLTGIEAFAYFTTIVNASQGLFIMISFVVNKRIYNMIKQTHSEITSYSKSTKVSNVGNFSSNAN